MAPTESQKTWLLAISGTGPKPDPKDTGPGTDIDSFELDLEQKEKILVHVRKRLEGIRAELDGAFSFVVGKRKALVESGTSLDEADFDDYRSSDVAITKEQQAKIHKGTTLLAELNEDLKKATSVATGRPLFTAREIAAEVWTPLVRERLLPETNVGEAYSEVQRMINETNDLYAQKVAELKKEGGLTKKTNWVALTAKSAAKLASIGVDVAGAFKEDSKAIVLAGQICEVTSTTIDYTEEVYDTLSDSSGLMQKASRLASAMISTYSSLLGSGLTKSLLQNGKNKEEFEADLAIIKNIQRACSAALASKKMLEAIIAKNPAAMLTVVGNGIGNALSDKFGDTLGKKLQDKMSSKVAEINKKYAQTKEGEEFEIDGKELIGSAFEELIGGGLLINEIRAQKSTDGKFLAAQKVKCDEAMQKEREDEKTAFKQFLGGGAAGAAAASSSSIDKLIKQIERDRKIAETALSIVKGGLGMATKLFAPLEMAATALDLIKSMAEAADRIIELRKWIATGSAMAKAQDSLQSSAQNFIKNQSAQFTHHTIQALSKAAQLIGQAMRLSPAAGAGAIVETLGKAGGEIEEISYGIYKAADLELAWKATKKAISNPKNRRLGLKARKANPSLAKYSIAWGALENNDPLAKDIMRKVGLSKASLAHPNTDTHKVVEYLETLYQEDDKLYREFRGDADWLPDEIELSIECWYQILSGANANCKNTLTPLPSDFPHIGSMLAALDKICSDHKQPDPVSLIESLGAPQDDDGEDDPDLNRVKAQQEKETTLAKVIDLSEKLMGALNTVKGKIALSPDLDSKNKKKAENIKRSLNAAIGALVDDSGSIANRCLEILDANKATTGAEQA